MKINKSTLTKTVQQQIMNKLSNCPNGYLVTSGNLISDLGLDTKDHTYDDFVFRALSNINCGNLLCTFGRKLVKIGYKSKFSRNGQRPAALYKVESL